MSLFIEINTFVYFEFLHGHIQHVNILDEKTLFRPFNGSHFRRHLDFERYQLVIIEETYILNVYDVLH